MAADMPVTRDQAQMIATLAHQLPPDRRGAAMTDVTKMTPSQRREWLAATKPRFDLETIIREHIFYASRPWPDGSRPTAPDWNPGCKCGEPVYFFEHAGHVADVIIAAGWGQTS